jgi:hypothetical protein
MEYDNDKQSRLELWKSRLKRNDQAYHSQLSKMDRREQLYLGSKAINPVCDGDKKKTAVHVRNICCELIEAQVDSTIPSPKVTARRPQDEAKAKLIEDMLRNELDRMNFEAINDQVERTVPIQGGICYLVEWDSTAHSHNQVGEIAVSTLHPKQVIPQDGVFTGIEDMDYIILKIPATKDSIERKYHVDVSEEREDEPEIKGDGTGDADDLVTQYIAYYRNVDGGIGVFSWVRDTILEDLEDYQARRLRRCTVCGTVEPHEASVIPLRHEDGQKKCPACGNTEWKEVNEDYEEVFIPIERTDGSTIPGATLALEETGETNEFGEPVEEVREVGTKIPFYKPNIYPVILQRNVSVYGQFLGDSDIDKIEDQQNTLNRMEMKIIDKLVKSGSYITLPDDASIKVDTEDAKVIRPGNAANAQLIHTFDLQGDVEYDLVYLSEVYEEARQVIGITDSYQGRQDRTATSGKAKEFAAAQSAGRLESKRIMKNAAYSALFEAIFKFKLAYADEPRPVVARDYTGNPEYRDFNRYDFLEQDETGEWFWNDQFLFSCDTTSSLASNREAMWQETRLNLQTGAFGDPASVQTLILFWSKMEMLHYPGAAETKMYLEGIFQQQQMQAQQEALMQQQQMAAQAAQQQAAQQQGQNRGSVQQSKMNELLYAVNQKAKEDAARDAASAQEKSSGYAAKDMAKVE